MRVCHTWQVRYSVLQGERKLVKEITQGGFFGEVALVTKSAIRVADCIAKTRHLLNSSPCFGDSGVEKGKGHWVAHKHSGCRLFGGHSTIKWVSGRHFFQRGQIGAAASVSTCNLPV